MRSFGPQGAKGQAVGPRGVLAGPAATMHAAMKTGFQGPHAQPGVRNSQDWGANFRPSPLGPPPNPLQRSVRTKSAVAQNWGAEFAPTANARQANILRRASLNGPRGANPMHQMHQSMMMQQNARAAINDDAKFNDVCAATPNDDVRYNSECSLKVKLTQLLLESKCACKHRWG